ncbi:hypothetical protein [Sorangium sp. So ce513]|uniref:hypothetical protein n=1 Tax=Sorangium sp. So ce513 TaxID=3133315 RepID=UPI003F638AC2
MISVAVKIETECGTCRMPVPVNTLAREVGCQSCGRPTVIGGEVWQALLRDPVYEGPKMLRNEGRRRRAGKVSATYSRRGPCCQGCERELSAASIQEVPDQAMLRCERCAQQTWVRRVSAELAGALPNITHLVGEDPDPVAQTPALAAEAATFPCPQCGSPVPFDGVNRACTCRFCSASVHVPDEFVYRGRRKVAASWFLCFHPSIVEAAPAPVAVAAGLFDWEELPEVVVDPDGNLYCAATQLHWVAGRNGDPKQIVDHVVWSIDSSLNVRWIQRNCSKAGRLVLFPDDTLLVIGDEKSAPAWLSCKAGTPAGEVIATAEQIAADVLDCDHSTRDRDGSLLVQKSGMLRRISPSGAQMPVWPKGAPWDEAAESAGADDEDEQPPQVTLQISAKGMLLVTRGENPSRAWLPFEAGASVDEGGSAAGEGARDLARREGIPLLPQLLKLQQVAASGAEIPGGPEHAPGHGDEVDDADAARDSDAAAEDAGDPFCWSLHSFPGRSEHLEMTSARVDCGPDGSIFLREADGLTRFDVSGRKIYHVNFPHDDLVLARHAFGADSSGNAYMLGDGQLMRVGATGARSVVLRADRDRLPRENMRIKVSPDGTFWLFGEKGLAWRFDSGGRLLFASEKEPRPRKPTYSELLQEKLDASQRAFQAHMAAVQAEAQRMVDEAVEREANAQRRSNRIGCVLSVVVAIAMFLFFMWENL